MKRAAVMTVAIVLALAGCGGGGEGQPSRERVLEVLGQDNTAAQSGSDADCIADAMLDAGLTSDQLDEAADWDGEGSQPEAVDLYNEALDVCGLSAEDQVAEALERIEGS